MLPAHPRRSPWFPKALEWERQTDYCDGLETTYRLLLDLIGFLCARSNYSEGDSRYVALAGVGPGNVEEGWLFSTLYGPKLRHERACANPCPISLITLRLERPWGAGVRESLIFVLSKFRLS